MKERKAAQQGETASESPKLSQKSKRKVEEIIAKDRGEVKIERLEELHPVLNDLISRYVDDWKKEHPFDKLPREWFYVSDVGKCPRSIYYQFKYPEKKREMSPHTIIMFAFGNIYHDEIQTKFRKIGYTTNKGVEFGTWSKLNFAKRGRLDVLLSEDGMTVVTEIKWKNPYGFQTEPEEWEVDQLLSYIEDCKKDPYFKGRNIADYGYVVYLDSGLIASPPLAMYRIWFSEKRVEVIKSEFSELWDCIQKNKTPERPYERESWRCQYCRFLEWCWRGIPLPPEPKFEKDETIEPPSYEIVESMASSYLQTDLQEKELAKQRELARKVLIQYFKGTGKDEIVIGQEKIKFSLSNSYSLDEGYLWKKFKKIFNRIARPQVSLLKAALKDGLIDGTTFEKAKKLSGVSESLRIIRPKAEEAKNGD